MFNGVGYRSFTPERAIDNMANWDETKERLKKQLRKITDNNLLIVKEKQEEVLVRLEAKLGQTREAILKIISEL
jgi:hypothetical protein